MRAMADTQMARGSTALATLDFIRREHGDDVLARIVARLAPATRERLTCTAKGDELPYGMLVALWESADQELVASHPRWAEEAGAFAIRSLGQVLYGGLLQKRTPMDFITQSVSLFRLYYSPGDIVAVEVEPGRTVARLEGFDAMGPLFCRRQTGGLVQAVEIAGGKDVTVDHVRCEHEGDCFCEWEIRWR